MENLNVSREQKVALYTKLVASHSDGILKGAAIQYTSLNGHTYSYFTKDDFVALKLPEDERVKFIDKYNTKLVEQYGVIQKEYVVVPYSLLEKTDELKPYFDISYRYTSTLKPKPTAKDKQKK